MTSRIAPQACHHPEWPKCPLVTQADLGGRANAVERRFGLRCLNLYRYAWLSRRTRRDDQITARNIPTTLNHLADRSECVDDRRPCRVGHEACQRFHRAAAGGPDRQGQNVGLLRLEPRYDPSNFKLVPPAGLEPARLAAWDFKSHASTSSAKGATGRWPGLIRPLGSGLGRAPQGPPGDAPPADRPIASAAAARL